MRIEVIALLNGIHMRLDTTAEEAPVIPERPAMEAQPEPVTKAAVPRHTADFSKTADYDIPDFLKQK